MLGSVNKAIGRLPARPDQAMLDAVVRHVHLAIEKVSELAKQKSIL